MTHDRVSSTGPIASRRSALAVLGMAVAAVPGLCPASAADDSSEPMVDVKILLQNSPKSGIAAGDLDRTKLDFSLESLKVIDDFMTRFHDGIPNGANGKNYAAIPEGRIVSVVMQIGSYTGEVLRRQPELGRYAWVSYDGALARSAGARDALGKPSISNTFVLMDGAGNMINPYGKVVKFMANGNRDSLWAFALEMKKVAGGQTVSPAPAK